MCHLLSDTIAVIGRSLGWHVVKEYEGALVLSGNFSLRSTWHGAMVIRCHETGDVFKEASVRRRLSRIIPKLSESVDWHGLPSRTKGMETLLCEHDVSNFKFLSI